MRRYRFAYIHEWMYCYNKLNIACEDDWDENRLITVSHEEKITNKIKEVEEKWHKNLNILSCYIEHNELEKVQRQITLIKGNIDIKEYNQAIPQLDECKFIINHIIDKETLLIRNIF